MRVIDNLVGGREQNLAHHRPTATCRSRSATSARWSPATRCSRAPRYVFHFAGIGDIVPSIERPTEYMSANVQGTVHVLEAARLAAALKKFVYAASSSCYGLADDADARGPPDRARSIPTRSPSTRASRRCSTGTRSTGCRSNSIRIFNAYGTRSRTSGAYGAVFGVFLRQKLGGQAVHGGRRRHAAPRLRLRLGPGEAFLAAAESADRGRVWNVGAGNPQTVNRLVELLGGPRVAIPKRPGEPDCTWADIARIKADLGWSPRISFEEGVSRILANIDYWREAPLWDPDSIAKATKTWFEMLSPDAEGRVP